MSISSLLLELTRLPIFKDKVGKRKTEFLEFQTLKIARVLNTGQS